MKTTSHTEILLIAATGVVIVVVAAIFVIQKDSGYFVSQSKLNPPPASRATAADPQAVGSLPTESELVEIYQTAVREIIKNYSSDSLNYQAGAVVYEKIVNDLLQLVVPPGYQSFHWELVLSFEKLAALAPAAAAGEPEARAEINTINQSLNDLFAQQLWWER